MTTGAYVPFHNNAESVGLALDSLLAQNPALDDIVGIDDGSRDDSVAVVKARGVRVIRLGANRGRGAARAAAMREVKCDLVASCDACNVLPPNFALQARQWFGDREVAAVYGVMTQRPGGGVVRRWRGRHLFRVRERPACAQRVAAFSTYGAMVRREAVLAAGNFDETLRYAEDADLGSRLSQRGGVIVFDPSLEAECVCENTLGQVLERYWRWHARPGIKPTLRGYWRDIVYSMRTLVPADLSEGDAGAAFISILAPHYRFWKTG